MNDIGDRLKDERLYIKKSQEELAVHGGITRQTQIKYEKNVNCPDAKYLAAVADLVDIQYVITGKRQTELPPSKVGRSGDFELSDNSDLIQLQLYEVEASAGGGSVVGGYNPVNYLPFSKKWLEQSLGIKVRVQSQNDLNVSDNLAVIYTRGDSMEPTIKNGDLLLINLDDSEVKSDAIYVVNYNHHLQVKRIQVKLNNQLTVKSDNDQYDPFVVKDAELSQLIVVGRVIWYGRGL